MSCGPSRGQRADQRGHPPDRPSTFGTSSRASSTAARSPETKKRHSQRPAAKAISASRPLAPSTGTVQAGSQVCPGRPRRPRREGIRRRRRRRVPPEGGRRRPCATSYRPRGKSAIWGCAGIVKSHTRPAGAGAKARDGGVDVPREQRGVPPGTRRAEMTCGVHGTPEHLPYPQRPSIVRPFAATADRPQLGVDRPFQVRER